MSQPNQPNQPNEPWYKSPLFIGFVLTVGGTGLFTLFYLFFSQWLLKR